MDFEDFKKLVIEAIDEAKTPVELLQTIVRMVYAKGVEDGKEIFS